MLTLLLSTTKLALQGSKKTFTVTNGQAQGGTSVARSAFAAISDVMDRNVESHPQPFYVNQVNCSNQGYVDDTMCMDSDNIGVIFSSKIIEETLEELSLEAHPEKTKNIVCGEKTWVEDMTRRLREKPAEIQGFRVKVDTSEKYLGVKIVSGDVSDIIEANIKFKASKSYQAATTIRQQVRDPRVERVGALQAASQMIRSITIPIITYGTECWLEVSEAQYWEMEKLLAEAISRVISIPKNSNYESMIMELSCTHIEQWMDCLKLCYFSKKLHKKKEGKLYRVLREDIIQGGNNGFIADLRNLSKKYKIPDVTLLPLTNKYIKSACKDLSRRRCMLTTLGLKKVPPMFSIEKILTDHYSLPVIEARAITVMRTGNLVFKNWAPHKMLKKHMGDKLCLVPACQEKDSLEHVMRCEFYSARFVEKEGLTKDWATYLVALNHERIEKFSQPMILCEGWSTINQ